MLFIRICLQEVHLLWQSEWDGLKSMKSETAQTLFFSDVFVPLSRCRRLALGTRAWPYLIPPCRSSQWKRYSPLLCLSLKGIHKSKCFFFVFFLFFVFCFFINFVSWNIFINALGLDFYEGHLLTFAGKDLLFNKSFIFECFVCYFL